MSIFDSIPSWVFAGGGLVAVGALFAAVLYFTRSPKAAIGAAVTLGVTILLAVIKKRGREEGIAAERARNEAAASERADNREENIREIDALSGDELDRRFNRWVLPPDGKHPRR